MLVLKIILMKFIYYYYTQIDVVELMDSNS